MAVYGAATGASVGAQALTCALMIGVAGASLPVAGAVAVAFGVGCCSGVTAGALSEWTVDKLYIGKKKEKNTTCSSGRSASSSSSENWKSADIVKQTKEEQQRLIEQTNNNDSSSRRQQSYHYYHRQRPTTRASPHDGGFMLYGDSTDEVDQQSDDMLAAGVPGIAN